jgi:hypothetical protein
VQQRLQYLRPHRSHKSSNPLPPTHRRAPQVNPPTNTILPFPPLRSPRPNQLPVERPSLRLKPPIRPTITPSNPQTPLLPPFLRNPFLSNTPTRRTARLHLPPAFAPPALLPYSFFTHLRTTPPIPLSKPDVEIYPTADHRIRELSWWNVSNHPRTHRILHLKATPISNPGPHRQKRDLRLDAHRYLCLPLSYPSPLISRLNFQR